MTLQIETSHNTENVDFHFLFPVFHLSPLQFCEKNDWPSFPFQTQITGYRMDGLSLGQMASTNPNSWGWGILFMWEKEVSIRGRCLWSRKSLIFLVSPLKVGGHGGYTQKFGDLQSLFSVLERKRETIQKDVFETNDKKYEMCS